MTEQLLLYITVWIIWLLAVFSFAIGIEKMIKIVLWNYILGSICLAVSQSLQLLINFLNTSPELKFAGFTYKSLWLFFADGKTTIVLIVYVILLVVIYKNSKIHIYIPEDPAVQKWLFVVFVPLTVLSMILTLQIAIMGVNFINTDQLQLIANELTKTPALYTFLTMTPVWILLHGLVTVIITSEMKIGLKTGM